LLRGPHVVSAIGAEYYLVTLLRHGRYNQWLCVTAHRAY